MHALVIIPGIMGTELFLPATGNGKAEKVWPPEPLETKFGYDRKEKLADPRVVTGRIIRNILCYGFYDELLKHAAQLGFTHAGGDNRLYEFPYDWRRDLFDAAKALAELLDAVHLAGAKRISLVAHSMGGLIARLVLENDENAGRPWFDKIDLLITIATPHLGAPLALARILGLDGSAGISRSDTKWLSNLEAYPSAYQLLPAPGDVACWNQSDPHLSPIDFHDGATARALGLNPALLARAQALHAVLGRQRRPVRVRYVYFAASGHRTVTRVNLSKKPDGSFDLPAAALTRTPDGGDGTVPLYSALPQLGQRQIVINEHATAFVGNPFKRVFFRLLGGNLGPALEGLVIDESGVPPVLMQLSVEAPVVAVDRDIEVLLAVDAPDRNGADGADRGTAEIAGALVLRRVAEDGLRRAEIVAGIEVRYTGPPIDRLRLLLPPTGKPGLYELRFEGVPAATRPVQFAASIAM